MYNTLKKGMDIALVMWERGESNRFQVSFAGAKRPFYYIEAGTTELKEIEATRKGIGGHQNENKQFVSNRIELESGSVFYACTDGIADQNNIQHKKVTSRGLKNLLEQTAHLGMNDQKTHLEEFIDEQLSGVWQRDNILLIGVKL